MISGLCRSRNDDSSYASGIRVSTRRGPYNRVRSSDRSSTGFLAEDQCDTHSQHFVQSGVADLVVARSSSHRHPEESSVIDRDEFGESMLSETDDDSEDDSIYDDGSGSSFRKQITRPMTTRESASVNPAQYTLDKISRSGPTFADDPDQNGTHTPTDSAADDSETKLAGVKRTAVYHGQPYRYENGAVVPYEEECTSDVSLYEKDYCRGSTSVDDLSYYSTSDEEIDSQESIDAVDLCVTSERFRELCGLSVLVAQLFCTKGSTLMRITESRARSNKPPSESLKTSIELMTQVVDWLRGMSKGIADLIKIISSNLGKSVAFMTDIPIATFISDVKKYASANYLDAFTTKKVDILPEVKVPQVMVTKQ